MDPTLVTGALTRRRLLGQWLGLPLATALPGAWAASRPPAPPQPPPAAVAQALRKAGIGLDAVAWTVADAADPQRIWLSHRADSAMHPASVIKLVTTSAGLDLLGPAHVWTTRLYADGPVRDGVLQGSLYIRGGGDPKLSTERLWLLLHRLYAMGIREVAGDWVIDRQHFVLPPHDPGQFDGEALRPYNASPDALLINFQSQLWYFSPDPSAGVARIAMEPPLAGVAAPDSVPLSDRPCQDWRSELKADWSDPLAPRFRGRYPADCGERLWPLAHPEPERFAERVLGGLWNRLGGRLKGQIRAGRVPTHARLLLSQDSPPLAEIVRDINKYSNNVMAQHLFLSLGRIGVDPDVGTGWDEARAAVQRWWRERLGDDVPPPVMDNGSGLSRETRISTAGLSRLLQYLYSSPSMPDLMASLPLSGYDGTLRRSAIAPGMAHLKTGSLRDVTALAGYVHGPQGQRRVLVAMVNHPQAALARPALQALVEWAASDRLT